MTNKSSINFQKVESCSKCERHFDNDHRRNDLEYVFNDRIEMNQSYTYPELKDSSLSEYKAQLEVMAKEKTGRKMQSKASPIKEGVINLNEKAGMKELRKFAKGLQLKFGVKPLRIEIHEDEGYQNKVSNEISYNRHAHLVVDWMDHDTGKSLKLNAFDMRDIQDLLAETLGMERGEKVDLGVIESEFEGRITRKNIRRGKGKKHLTPIEYKDKREREKAQNLRERLLEYKEQGRWGKVLGKDKKIDFNKSLENMIDLLDAHDHLQEQYSTQRTELSALTNEHDKLGRNYMKIKNDLEMSNQKLLRYSPYFDRIDEIEKNKGKENKKTVTRRKDQNKGSERGRG